MRRPSRVCSTCIVFQSLSFFLLANTLFFVSTIAKRGIPQAVGMLSGFKNKLNQKRSAIGTGPTPTEAARVSSSKNPKKRPREGGNTVRTFRARGEMPTPPPSRTVTRPASPLTNTFNRPIPTTVAQEFSLALLGGDRCFTWAMNFNFPPGVEELIRSVLEEDILDSGVEMICRGLMLTC